MKRQKYHGYIIDTDNLGRPYIYNTDSPYSEDSDRILVAVERRNQVTQIRAIIDARIKTGQDVRKAVNDPYIKGSVRLI